MYGGAWWPILMNPEKPLGRKEGGETEIMMAGKRESFVLISQLKKLGRHIQMSDYK